MNATEFDGANKRRGFLISKKYDMNRELSRDEARELEMLEAKVANFVGAYDPSIDYIFDAIIELGERSDKLRARIDSRLKELEAKKLQDDKNK